MNRLLLAVTSAPLTTTTRPNPESVALWHGGMTAEKPSSRGRRLGAIMFTDVVGYSGITARDENRALRVLDEHRNLLQSVFPKHEGRVVKTMGDGFLVEFASAVEAVDCAVEAQFRMRGFNSMREPSDRISIRIGIQVGDIVHEGGDVLGDAVNVASRVEPMAEPGGICVTRQVVDQVEGKGQWKFDSMGLRKLRNIPNSIELFRVVPQQEAIRSERRRVLDSHRIAILPFSNLSPDPNDRYFTDGMTEELISTVSKISDLSVISRASAMRYRDTPRSMDQIGIELEVGAVLEGSVRKSGNKVRIAAQLIEVEGDRYVWSQSYDRDLTDVFAIQSDIAERVAASLKVQLLTKERQMLGKKSTESPEAYTLYLKGRFSWNERTQDGITKAIRYFEEAARIDPNFALAYSGVADCYAILADYGWMEPAIAGRLARENVMRALSIDDGLAEAHASLGLVSVNHFWDFATGEKEFRRAIELNPNYSPTYHWYAVMLAYARRYEDSLKMIERAIEVDPYSPAVRLTHGMDLLSLTRVEESLDEFEKIAEINPDFVAAYYWKAVAFLLQSKYDIAIETARKEVALDGESDNSKLDLVYVLASAGQREPARKLLDEVLSKPGTYLSPSSVGIAELGLGDDDEGFRWLEKAYADHDSQLINFRSIPVFKRHWSDPRWLEIDRRIGFGTTP